MSTLWTAIPLECATTSIRIFTIDRVDDRKANLHCTFRVVSLIEDPSFTAISYTWRNALGPRESPFEQGLPPATHNDKTIICNGFEVPILDNLHHALFQLHTSYASGTQFWADALCIDQSNISERSQQVSAMAEIFKTAQCVIIWLGPGTKTVSKALEFVELMASLSAEAMQAFAFGNASPDVISDEVDSKLSRKDYWQALELFFSRSWFIRAWIVQETILATRLIVLCGNGKMTWNKLCLTSRYLLRFAQNLAPLHPAFFTEGVYFDTPARLDAGRKNEFSPGTDGLLYSLILSRRHLCFDVRDTVFSLVGIARVRAAYETEHPLPLPDYSATPASVFHQTALHILGASDNLLLLAYAEGSTYRPTAGLPSWVPDWSVRKGLGLAYTGYKSFQADGGGGRPRYLQLRSNARVLAIEVAMVDSVTMVGETKESVLRTGHFPQWLAILASLPVVSLHGQSRKQVLWRTLLTDIVPDHNGLHHPAPQEFDELFDSWLRGCAQMSQQRKRHADGSLEPAADTGRSVYATASQRGLHWLCDLLTTTRESVTAEGDFIRAARFRTVYSNSLHVRLFRTARGYLGVGSESIREGDDVCIASGSRVPLVVRPRQKVAGQKLQYELVGAAYVHGIMHGEALRCSSVGFQTVELA